MTERCEPPEELREQDRLHWLERRSKPQAALWRSGPGEWYFNGWVTSVPEMARRGFSYLEPVLTPAETAAMRDENARLREALEVASAALRARKEIA